MEHAGRKLGYPLQANFSKNFFKNEDSQSGK